MKIFEEKWVLVSLAVFVMARIFISVENLWIQKKQLSHYFKNKSSFASDVFPWQELWASLLILVLACVHYLSPVAVNLLLFCFLILLWISIMGTIFIWRAPPSGGADSLSLIICFGFLIHFAQASFIEVPIIHWGLVWIVAQVILSYFVSGITKVFNSNWRMGRALQNLVEGYSPYAFRPEKIALPHLYGKKLLQSLSWAMMLFEIAFIILPILPWHGRVALLMIAGCFHLIAAKCFGLNRFWLTWISTYPLLLIV